jgi:sarcosine oxidase
MHMGTAGQPGAKRVAIVGAGVVGLAAAAELRWAGAEVRLYEKALPGQAQSQGMTRISRFPCPSVPPTAVYPSAAGSMMAQDWERRAMPMAHLWERQAAMR